jgi:hypothetical protein
VKQSEISGIFADFELCGLERVPAKARQEKLLGFGRISSDLVGRMLTGGRGGWICLDQARLGWTWLDGSDGVVEDWSAEKSFKKL